MDPYQALALMEAYGASYPLLSEEEVIHEARRKQRRIGPSPPHPRGMISFPTFVPEMVMTQQRSSRGQENTAGAQGPSTQPPAAAGQSNSRIRTELQDAMKELRAVVKKIRKLTRSLEDSRGSTYFTVVEGKMEELLGALSGLTGSNLGPSGSSGGGGAIPVPRRAEETFPFRTVGRGDAEKRKRSRTIITLKRTYETMDIDMDPEADFCAIF